MGLGGIICNLLSLGAKLLPAIKDSALKVSSSSSSLPPIDPHKLEAELEALMRILERIKVTLYDAEQREIRDKSVQLWLKELKEVAYDAEDILDEYHYEVLRSQVEARHACPPDSRKRKLIQVPDGMFDQIQKIRNRFSEIEKYRRALRLLKEAGPVHCKNQSQIAPTSHIIDASSIFGRDRERDKLINMLCFEAHDNNQVVSVVTIVGTGGLGKTTLAQIAYNDKKVRERFDKFGWVCVSQEFNVKRITRELVESITQKMCGFTNMGALQVEIIEAIRGKRVLLVLDDVWNEKRNLWELFQVPLRSATHVKILVTTRSEHVAQIMQTEPTFFLGYLSEEQCWRLFEHYAFGRVNQSMRSNFVEIGEKIMKKCGMLPLAVKSIASLLRHELNEESWREILESELWETDASDEIFPSLQLSYIHLPTFLKPCLIFCSMFPKGFKYDTPKLVQLWICQGYIESKEKKSAQEIGLEYANQLWQRSFFESRDEYGNNRLQFRLHDIIHDLARLNSKKGCYSIEAGALIKLPDSNELFHLCIAGSNKSVEAITFEKFTVLRTLIMMDLDVGAYIGTSVLSMAQKLRALEIDKWNDKLKYFSLIGNFKHLHYLSLGYFPFAYLPESIYSLYNLQILKLMKCPLSKLPTNIGNLVSLEQLEIRHCYRLKGLPESLCQVKALKELILDCCIELEELPSGMGISLTNLQTLKIDSCEVHSLPPSCSKFIGIRALHAMLECETIGWLEHFVDLGGILHLGLLKNVSNLTDVRHANLVSMQNLNYIELCWDDYDKDIDGNGFWLYIRKDQKISLEEDQNDYAVMAALQPHPNLTTLRIQGYGCSTYPGWIGNPNICASLERILIQGCQNLTVLPFGNLRKLKYLGICGCNSLGLVSAESLPRMLEELHIERCRELKSVPGIRELKSLVKLNIVDCENLHMLVMDAAPSIGLSLTMDTNESSCQLNSTLGLGDLPSLKRLHIGRCPRLQLPEDEQLCVESCEVDIRECPLLRQWCLQHGIDYKDSFSE